jgi:uroporphyrinogen-III synthase
VDAELALLMSGSAARALRTRIPVVAIGPQTADEARRAGLEVVAVAEPHTVDGLVEALASLA